MVSCLHQDGPILHLHHSIRQKCFCWYIVQLIVGVDKFHPAIFHHHTCDAITTRDPYIMQIILNQRVYNIIEQSVFDCKKAVRLLIIRIFIK